MVRVLDNRFQETLAKVEADGAGIGRKPQLFSLLIISSNRSRSLAEVKLHHDVHTGREIQKLKSYQQYLLSLIFPGWITNMVQMNNDTS